MSAELEKEVLGTLIRQPHFLEFAGEDLTDEIFLPGEKRKIFLALTKIWEDSKPETIDEALLADQARVEIGKISELTLGVYKISPEAFLTKVRALRRKRLAGRLYDLTKRELENYLRTDTWDSAQFERSRLLVDEISRLEQAAGHSFIRASDVEPKKVNWLWAGRVPRGMLTIIAGNPGELKTSLAGYIAARLSIGGTLPDDSGPMIKKSAVILAAEDSAAYALRPRLEANGADLKRIYILEDSTFSLSAALRQIRQLLNEDPDVGLIVLDPLNAFLGPDRNYFVDIDTRLELRPLLEFISERELACLAIAHLNKKTDIAAILRIPGSFSFAAQARSILMVTRDKEENEKRRLYSAKMNYARTPKPLIFSMADDLSLNFEVDAPIDETLEEALVNQPPGERQNRGFVTQWLAETLSVSGGVPQPEILKLAQEAEIGQSSVYYAREKLGVQTMRDRDENGKKILIWMLPSWM